MSHLVTIKKKCEKANMYNFWSLIKRDILKPIHYIIDSRNRPAPKAGSPRFCLTNADF